MNKLELEARLLALRDHRALLIREAEERLRQLLAIPHDTDWRATRYDTDDEHVLHLWRPMPTIDNPSNGESFDIRFPKCSSGKYSTLARRELLASTELKKLLSGLRLKSSSDADGEASCQCDTCRWLDKVLIQKRAAPLREAVTEDT